MVAAEGGGGFGSEAVIGIVVASVCVLLIVIGAVIAYIVCRMRRQAAKNTTTTPNPQADPHMGQALPADIPIEAVNRVPPPAYAPPRRPSHTQRRSRPSVRTSGTTGQNGTCLSPPPPYAAAVSGTIATIDMNCEEAPPEYRSRVGLNSSVGDIQQLTSNPRTISVDSFTEYPSMRNIVETSSRSSLQGTDSRHASQSDRSSAGPSARAGRLSGGGDSARGDSVESRSSRSDDPTNLRQYHRAISSSSSALYDPRLSIPEGGLQRRVRKTKQQQQQQQQSTATTAQVNTELNRSCPSLVSDDTDNPSRSGNDGESHAVPAQHGGRHRRHRATEADSPSSSASAAAAVQKRRRYKRKDGSAKSQRLSTSTEYSGDLENQFQLNGRGHAYGTDTSASSLPSLSSPITRFQVAGTCDV